MVGKKRFAGRRVTCMADTVGRAGGGRVFVLKFTFPLNSFVFGFMRFFYASQFTRDTHK